MIEQEDVLDLIKKSKDGDIEARSKLVEENLPLVKSIVKRFTGRLEYDDLMQLGAIGLIKAIAGFDQSFDVRFSTYAVPMITGEIKRFLRDDGAVKVSRAMKSLNYKIIKYVEEYKSSHEKDPSIAEISEAVGADAHDIVFAMESSSAVTSLYAENEDGDCFRRCTRTYEEIQTFVALIGVTGGTVMLSDKLRRLTDGQTDLFRVLLPVNQRAGIPVVHVTNLTKISEGIGANRILRGNSVLHQLDRKLLGQRRGKAHVNGNGTRVSHNIGIAASVDGSEADSRWSHYRVYGILGNAVFEFQHHL